MPRKDYIMRFRERFARFMYGRYGADALYRFLMWICLGLVVVEFIVSKYAIPASIIGALEIILFSYTMFRFFSRNTERRRRENDAYLRAVSSVKGFFTLRKNKRLDSKTHVFRRCPHCHVTIRLPKKKGKHGVTCPKCFTHFEVRILFDGKPEIK